MFNLENLDPKVYVQTHMGLLQVVIWENPVME